MEHIERAGIHSGDSISIYPSQTISKEHIDTIVDYTRRIAMALHVSGLINIQFIVRDDGVWIIEANPRSSRTVPYISKVTGVPIVDIATRVIAGAKIPELGYRYGLWPDARHIAVKMPVFSFEKLRGADISLGPQMKSTGEVLGIAEDLNEALYKAFLGAGLRMPERPVVIITVADHEKAAVIPIAKQLQALGCEIFATTGTMKALSEQGVNVRFVNKVSGGSPNILELIEKRKVDLIVDIPTKGDTKNRDGFLIRRTAVESGVPCMTSLDTVRALVDCVKHRDVGGLSVVDVSTI
jgi:carbamoyl-phosphate synthase large subunit